MSGVTDEELEAMTMTPDEFERRLVESGRFSRAAAKYLASRLQPAPSDIEEV